LSTEATDHIAEKDYFGYHKIMTFLYSLIAFMVFCLPVYAGEPDGKAYFQKGKNDLEKKNYDEAISSLSRAEKEFPVLGDYALLWLSDAYHESGNHQEALTALRTFLRKYPNSSLVKKVRSKEIKEAEELSETCVRQLFEAYLKDYPGETEIKYLFAQWLKKNGQQEKAKSVFKDIYIEAGPFSGTSYSELSPSDISVEDMSMRASNLTKLMDYKNAELLLRSALEKDDGRSKADILKKLGQTLFKQKRYHEAAETYQKAKDRFWEVRSLYRAREKDVIDAALDEILKNGEKKFSPILMAIAADKRREGKAEEALRIYQTVIKRFPSETEDALWGVGWTYFLTGEYQRASEVFGRLYNTSNEPKYLYWKTRSLEANGKKDLKNDQISTGKARDYYSVMLYVRTRASSEPSSLGETRKIVNPITPVKSTPLVYKKNDRIEALLDLGLQKEALAEMVFLSKKTSSIDDILYICAKSQELKEYSLSVRSAGKVPYTDELHDFLYPLAHWDIVKSVSAKYAIDPLLVLAIVREESRFDPEARSPAGAIGLMQLMPHTALRLDNKLKLGINGARDLLDAKNNLHFGAYYLSNLVKEFGSYPYAIAAYNAGEDIVRKWIQKGGYKSADEFIEDIPYDETRKYVKRVLTSFFEYKRVSLAGEDISGIPFEKL
jgi:soluble lytic murein transglycosylase